MTEKEDRATLIRKLISSYHEDIDRRSRTSMIDILAEIARLEALPVTELKRLWQEKQGEA